MQLSDGDTQSALYAELKQHQDYKGQASGGSAANTTVAFSALGGTAFMVAALVTMIWVQFICKV